MHTLSFSKFTHYFYLQNNPISICNTTIFEHSKIHVLI
jgi:hypothetical protein